MLMIPFPLVLAEIFFFFVVLSRLGFFPTVLIYFAPCLLGLLIISVWGRFAMGSFRSVQAGKNPETKVLHTLAIFVAGIGFLVPSVSSRILAIALILPGLRHLIIWKMKEKILKKMSTGAFQFGGTRFGGPGFGGGFGQGPSRPQNPFEGFPGMERPVEREVREANVLDIRPIKVTHTSDDETKKDS